MSFVSIFNDLIATCGHIPILGQTVFNAIDAKATSFESATAIRGLIRWEGLGSGNEPIYGKPAGAWIAIDRRV